MEWDDRFKLACVALIALAVIGPISACEIRQSADQAKLQKACIEAKGDWQIRAGMGACTFPRPVN